jgi:hypothetical protein
VYPALVLLGGWVVHELPVLLPLVCLLVSFPLVYAGHLAGLDARKKHVFVCLSVSVSVCLSV